MSVSSRGGRAVTSLLKGESNICNSCRITQLRPYSSVVDAATSAEAHHLKPTSAVPHPPVTASRRAEYRIKSGVVLTRPPLLTRPLTPFENAFFFYQKRLNERLVLPFRHTMYFKQGSSAELDYKIKFKERDYLTAKELGRYYPSGRNAWNDELIVGSSLSSEERIREILVKDGEGRVTEDGEIAKSDEIVPAEKPMDRITEADKTNDIRRLDRKLDRTLYLLVRTKDGKWGFPAAGVRSDENLHETAARVLEASAGVNMNVWMVGRVPIAHTVTQPEFGEDASLKNPGEKVFFLKGRIMAGQADLKDNTMGLDDFNWLTREELKEKLPESYFHQIRNMLAVR